MRRLFVLAAVVAVTAMAAISAQTPGGFRSDVQKPPFPWTHLRFSDDGDTLRFAIVSDRTGGHREGVFEKGIRAVNLLSPDLVMCVGDLVEGYEEDPAALDRQYGELDEIVGRLKTPFFFVAGNHDISLPIAVDRYRTHYGRPYYHFVYKNALFLVLCTEDPPGSNISDEQIAYVKKTLQANPNVRWTFVFLHKPLFHLKEAPCPGWKQIEQMLFSRPYTVFAGHWHNYSPYTKGERKYIVLATTGGASDLAGPESGSFDEIVWVALGKEDKQPTITNLAMNAILPWDFRPPVLLDNTPSAKQEETPLIAPAHTQAPGGFRSDVQGPPYPWTNLRFADDGKTVRFAIVSDRCGWPREGVFERAMGMLNDLQPEFVISVGDAADTPDDEQSTSEFDREHDVLDGIVKRLKMPFFLVAGNHEIYNAMAAERYPTRHGRAYYHFVYKNVLFLALNTEDPPPSNFSDEQITYAKKTLQENANVRWTFVFLHKLMIDHPGWKQIESAFGDRPCTVFAGDKHVYQAYKKNGRQYIVLATTGGNSKLLGPWAGSFDEIAWVALRDGDQQPTIANLAMDGILPWDFRPVTPLEYLSLVKQGVTLSAEPVYLTKEPAGPISTKLCLANTAELPAKVHLTFSPPAGVTVEPKEKNLDLPVGASQELEIRLSVSPNQTMKADMAVPFQYTAEYRLEGLKPFQTTSKGNIGVTRKLPCLPAPGRITVDGKLDDWPLLGFKVNKPPQVLINPVTHHGPEDGRFRFGVTYDENYLYIAVEVVDDAVSPSADCVWQQDGVEVRINANPPGKQDGAGDWTDLLPILVAPAGEGRDMLIWEPKKLPEGTKVVSARTPTGHITEIAVPISYLEKLQGKPWKQFRLNVAVDDFDADGGAQLWWKGDWRTPANLPGSGTFERK